MKKTYELTMLLDFYGELLTQRQRECAIMYFNEDLSLAEISEILGITRQGVRDILVRTEAFLTETEEKIGLIKRFAQQREIFADMAKQLDELAKLTSGQAEKVVSELRESLNKISI